MIPFRQKILLSKYITADEWGNPVYSDPYPLRARVTEKEEWVTDAFGQEVLQKIRIIFPNRTQIALQDKIQYGDEVARHPIFVQVKRDLQGRPLLVEVGV